MKPSSPIFGFGGRSVGTFAQLASAATLVQVARVEAVPLLYPAVRVGAASIGARDPSGQVFPTWTGLGGAQGEGVVVAILDTGINDEPEGSYPGHESLAGRALGGAAQTLNPMADRAPTVTAMRVVRRTHPRRRGGPKAAAQAIRARPTRVPGQSTRKRL